MDQWGTQVMQKQTYKLEHQGYEENKQGDVSWRWEQPAFQRGMEWLREKGEFGFFT